MASRSDDDQPQVEKPATRNAPTSASQSAPADGVGLPSCGNPRCKELEAAIGRAEERFQALLAGTRELLFVHREGRILYANPALLDFLGYGAADLVGKPIEELLHHDEPEAAAARIETMLAPGTPAPMRELHFVRRDGTLATIEIVSQPIEYSGTAAILSFLRDVTERRALEERLIEADRLASVGALATGVAHAINNPLATVLASLVLVGEGVDSLEPLVDAHPEAARVLRAIAESVEAARAGAERVRAVVDDLRGWSRADGIHWTPSDDSERATWMQVFLPAADPSAARPAIPPLALEPALTPRARILVVDDEVPLANALRRMLGSEHEVLTVNGGRRALELLRSDGNFHVVLCDLMMPDVTGMDVFETAVRELPALESAFVFMSGGAFTQRARQFLERVGNPCLEKPFDVRSVRALVRGVIRRRR